MDILISQIHVKQTSIDPTLVSVVMPVFNQEDNITHVLHSLVSRIRLKSEIIIIGDCSSDGTFNAVVTFFESNNLPQINKVTVIRFRWQKFETFCDDFGVRLAIGKYIIELQADMMMLEVGFDKKFLDAYLSHPDVFMLSGKGVHSLSYLEFLKGITFFDYLKHYLKKFLGSTKIPLESSSSGVPFEISSPFNGKAGRLGRNFALWIEDDDAIKERCIYFGNTVMRGPLFFERNRYFEIQGLNYRAFVLGDDDHDLCLRAQIDKGWKVGFVPIGVVGLLRHSSFLKKKSLQTILLYLVNLVVKWRYFKKSAIWNCWKESLLTEPHKVVF